MILGLYADPHISETSSILVGRGTEFSNKLETLIKSFDWMNNLFKDNNVDEIICLGDMTDKPNLSAEEITAMSRCHIEKHWLLIGNHCRADKSGKINSLSIYNRIINEPKYLFDGVYCLPYNQEPIELDKISPKPKIILSHNDLKDYDFGGGHLSSSGYSVNNILNSCDLFINGHLHNGGWLIKDRIMNLGIFSGINFSSCNGQWEPSVAILDTETLKIQLYENPYAYRFKKVEFDNLLKVKSYIDNIPNNGQYVIQFKIPYTISEQVRKLADQSSHIVASRILSYDKQADTKTKEKVQEYGFKQESIYDLLKTFIGACNTNLNKTKLLSIIDNLITIEGNS